MNMVMRVSDQVVALDFGRKIADGTPAEVQANADVVRAYLGTTNERGASEAAPVAAPATNKLLACAGRAPVRPDARCCTASISRSRRAASPPSSAPTAPARRRRCARSATWSRRSGEIGSTASASTARRTENIVRRGVAHVPDGRGTFMNLSVEENLRLGAYTRRDRAEVGARLRARLRLLPAPEGAPPPAGRHAVGRRAADARGRRAR